MSAGADRRQARVAAAARAARASRRGGAGGTLLGVFIGVALGLAIAAALAFYLTRAGNPYQSNAAGNTSRDVTRAAPGRPAPADAATEKPRFDFYKILPGADEPKVQARPANPSADRATVDRTLGSGDASADTASRGQNGAAPPAASARPAERFWLQAGSFSTEGDAENLKARLAFAGWEATVQQAAVPDKGVRYRVRLGPFDNTDELNRIKGELGQRGFEVAVIKF